MFSIFNSSFYKILRKDSTNVYIYVLDWFYTYMRMYIFYL